MIAALMGIKACLIYGIVTFTASVIFGVILEKAGYAGHVKNVRMKNQGENDNTIPLTFKGKFLSAFSSAWGDFKAFLRGYVFNMMPVVEINLQQQMG